MLREHIRTPESITPVARSSAIGRSDSVGDGGGLSVGDRVEARTNKGQGDFRPGEVTHVRLKGKSADIRFDDGSEEKSVLREHIRTPESITPVARSSAIGRSDSVGDGGGLSVGDRVEARTNKGQGDFRPGEVTHVRLKGKSADIRFDDGSEEKSVLREHIRTPESITPVARSSAIGRSDSVGDGGGLSVGDRVEARTNKGQGDFRPGEVTHVRLKGKSADIRFDDGSEEKSVLREHIRTPESITPVARSSAIGRSDSVGDGGGLSVGDRVEARTNKGQGDFRPGEVTHVRLKGKSADIRFDDGSEEKSVLREHIRTPESITPVARSSAIGRSDSVGDGGGLSVGDRVEARTNKGQGDFRPGEVTHVRLKGKSADIRFDDGSEEKSVLREHIRTPESITPVARSSAIGRSDSVGDGGGLSVGDRVEARTNKGQGDFRPGEVTHVRLKGKSADIRFDDGSEEKSVLREHIRTPESITPVARSSAIGRSDSVGDGGGLSVGDRVEARTNKGQGDFRPGEVTHVRLKGKSADIRFDDGSEEKSVLREHIRTPESITPVARSSAIGRSDSVGDGGGLSVGDRVEARTNKGQGDFRPGEVTHVRLKGKSADIRFDDGSEEKSVLREHIRTPESITPVARSSAIGRSDSVGDGGGLSVGDRVEARTNKGQGDFRPGEVTHVRLKGKSADIRFDDGSEEKSVLRAHICAVGEGLNVEFDGPVAEEYMAPTMSGEDALVADTGSFAELDESKNDPVSTGYCEDLNDMCEDKGPIFSPDHSWIAKLSGRELIESAEIIICEDMIGCMGGWRDVEAMGEWKRVVSYAMHVCAQEKDSEGGDSGLKFMDLLDFANMWDTKTTHPLSDRVLSAMLVCCGSGFVRLIGDVADVLTPPKGSPPVLPSDKSTFIKKLIEGFAWKKLSPLLRGDAPVIELNLLRNVLQEQEALLSVWTVQMARIAPFIDEIGKDVSSPVSPADLKELSDRLGMPSLSPKRIASFARMVMTGVSLEVKFDSSGAERSYWQQLRMACAHRRDKDPIREYLELIDMLIDPAKRRSASVSSASILSIFNIHNECFSDPDVDVGKITLPSTEMCVQMQQSNSFLSQQVVLALILVWCGDLCTAEGANEFIVFNVVRNHSFGPSKVGSPTFVSLAVVTKFLYPFRVSVRSVSVLGKAHFKRVVRAYDTTEALYSALVNKFAMKFKKQFAASEDARKLKMPTDLRLYCSDAAGGRGEEIRPSKVKMVADVCGDDSVFYMESVNVESYCATHSTHLNKKKEPEEKSTTQHILDMLTNPPVVTVKAAKPFPYAYDTAHTWSVSITFRYLEEVIELPQYETNFLRYEINGYALLCLDEQATSRCCGVEDELHSAKIALHADNLRRRVFKTALKHLPPLLRDWHPVHIAALLQFRYNSPKGSVSVLRRQLDGNRLADMSHDSIASYVSKLGCAMDESKRAIEGLSEVLDAHLIVIKDREDSKHGEGAPRLTEETEKALNQAVQEVDPAGTHRKESTAMALGENLTEVGAHTYRSSAASEVPALEDGPPQFSIDGDGELSEETENESAVEDEDDHSDLDVDMPTHLEKNFPTPSAARSVAVDMDELSRSVKFSHADTQFFDVTGNTVANETQPFADIPTKIHPPSIGGSVSEVVLSAREKSSSAATLDPTLLQYPKITSASASTTPSNPPKHSSVARNLSAQLPADNNVDPATSSILKHITALQRVVESHSGMVKSLQRENKRLRKEREKSDAFLRETMQQALSFRGREDSRLQVERDAALKSLTTVSQLYIDDFAAGAVDNSPQDIHPNPPGAARDSVPGGSVIGLEGTANRPSCRWR